MTVMERKLDRIIDALDRMTGSMPVSSSEKVAKKETVHKDTLYGKGRIVRDHGVGGPPLAHVVPDGPPMTPPLHHAVPDLAGRVAAVEQDLRTVQQLLEELVGRVNALERAGQPAASQPGAFQPGFSQPAVGPLPLGQPGALRP